MGKLCLNWKQNIPEQWQQAGKITDAVCHKVVLTQMPCLKFP